MSCKTRLGQLQTCIDTSVTLNSITNSNRTTTRHMRAPILTCHNARVSPLGNFPCVTHDNTEHASRTEKEPLQMHLRNRSGVMHTRWLFKHTQMLEHTSMSTRYCRPSHNARKIMNAFTCDPDLQRASLSTTVNDWTLHTDFMGRWQMAQRKDIVFALLTQNWLIRRKTTGS